MTFHQPVWPLLLYGHLWYSGLSAYTCRGGEGKKYMDNTHSPKLGENSQPALNRRSLTITMSEWKFFGLFFNLTKIVLTHMRFTPFLWLQWFCYKVLKRLSDFKV